MFRINSTSNRLEPLRERAFGDLGFTERAHLQEWLVNHPSALGEDLLVIQKEFAGFADTRERLDVLALDKTGGLVIIENKLDDSGRDVVWQALKYASYCSTLTRDGVLAIYQDYLGSSGDAEGKLTAFFETDDLAEVEINKSFRQRIVLVAANFRKEVTSTVLWLANYGIQMQCHIASVYESGGEHFLSLRQIIPTPTAEDYMISLVD